LKDRLLASITNGSGIKKLPLFPLLFPHLSVATHKYGGLKKTTQCPPNGFLRFRQVNRFCAALTAIDAKLPLPLPHHQKLGLLARPFYLCLTELQIQEEMEVSPKKSVPQQSILDTRRQYFIKNRLCVVLFLKCILKLYSKNAIRYA